MLQYQEEKSQSQKLIGGKDEVSDKEGQRT